jgi:drug/metabolite transporter (DMT)-like permease
MASRTVVPGTRHWPLAALLLASVLWGGAITGTKYALRAFDPVTLLGVELAAATAALWAVLLIRGYRPPPSWPAAVLLGLLEPALVVILAALVLGEAISRAGIVAVVACLAGLVVLTGGGGRSTAVGDLCIVGGVLSASLYSVLAKRFADDSDALSLTTWQFTAATAVALAVAPARWVGHPDRLPIAVAPPVLVGCVGPRSGRLRAEFPDLQQGDLRGERRLGGHRSQPHPGVRAAELHGLPRRGVDPSERASSAVRLSTSRSAIAGPSSLTYRRRPARKH